MEFIFHCAVTLTWLTILLAVIATLIFTLFSHDLSKSVLGFGILLQEWAFGADNYFITRNVQGFCTLLVVCFLVSLFLRGIKVFPKRDALLFGGFLIGALPAILYFKSAAISVFL